MVIFFFPRQAVDAHIPLVENLFFASLSIVIGVLFSWFGGRLFLMLKSFPIDSTARRSKLQQVGSVTGICTICFILQGVLLLITSFVTQIDMNAYIILTYYVVVEVLPSGLVLLILNRLPPQSTASSDSPRFPTGEDGYGSIAESGDERNSSYSGSRGSLSSLHESSQSSDYRTGNYRPHPFIQ